MQARFDEYKKAVEENRENDAGEIAYQISKSIEDNKKDKWLEQAARHRHPRAMFYFGASIIRKANKTSEDTVKGIEFFSRGLHALNELIEEEKKIRDEIVVLLHGIKEDAYQNQATWLQLCFPLKEVLIKIAKDKGIEEKAAPEILAFNFDLFGTEEYWDEFFSTLAKKNPNEINPQTFRLIGKYIKYSSAIEGVLVRPYLEKLYTYYGSKLVLLKRATHLEEAFNYIFRENDLEKLERGAELLEKYGQDNLTYPYTAAQVFFLAARCYFKLYKQSENPEEKSRFLIELQDLIKKSVEKLIAVSIFQMPVDQALRKIIRFMCSVLSQLNSKENRDLMTIIEDLTQADIPFQTRAFLLKEVINLCHLEINGQRLSFLAYLSKYCDTRGLTSDELNEAIQQLEQVLAHPNLPPEIKNLFNKMLIQRGKGDDWKRAGVDNYKTLGLLACEQLMLPEVKDQEVLSQMPLVFDAAIKKNDVTFLMILITALKAKWQNTKVIELLQTAFEYLKSLTQKRNERAGISDNPDARSLILAWGVYDLIDKAPSGTWSLIVNTYIPGLANLLKEVTQDYINAVLKLTPQKFAEKKEQIYREMDFKFWILLPHIDPELDMNLLKHLNRYFQEKEPQHRAAKFISQLSKYSNYITSTVTLSVLQREGRANDLIALHYLATRHKFTQPGRFWGVREMDYIRGHLFLHAKICLLTSDTKQAAVKFNLPEPIINKIRKHALDYLAYLSPNDTHAGLRAKLRFLVDKQQKNLEDPELFLISRFSEEDYATYFEDLLTGMQQGLGYARNELLIPDVEARIAQVQAEEKANGEADGRAAAIIDNGEAVDLAFFASPAAAAARPSQQAAPAAAPRASEPQAAPPSAGPGERKGP